VAADGCRVCRVHSLGTKTMHVDRKGLGGKAVVAVSNVIFTYSSGVTEESHGICLVSGCLRSGLNRCKFLL
jgi:hypothetical protein